MKGSLGVPSLPVIERNWDSVSLRFSLLRLTRFQVPRCIWSARGRSVLPWRSPATSLRSTLPSEMWGSMGAFPSSLWKQASSNIGITCTKDRQVLRPGKSYLQQIPPFLAACCPSMAMVIRMPRWQGFHRHNQHIGAL